MDHSRRSAKTRAPRSRCSTATGRPTGHDLPSISSVYRFLKTHGYDRRSLRAGRLESGPQKAFEAPAPNDLWMVDFACGPTLRGPDGRGHSPPSCASSSTTTAGSSPLAPTIPTPTPPPSSHCLKEAVLRRGLPLKLYTDQGKPFVSHHVRIVCANLGIRLLHAKPYHAWSKGKVERLIRTIQGDFEATLRLEGRGVHSLAELNTAFSRWIATIYHLRVHGSTGHESARALHPGRATRCAPSRTPSASTPSSTPAPSASCARTAPSPSARPLYEVDLALRALKVELRYDPLALDRVEVWHQGSFHGLATPANLHLNSQTYNRSQQL